MSAIYEVECISITMSSHGGQLLKRELPLIRRAFECGTRTYGDSRVTAVQCNFIGTLTNSTRLIGSGLLRELLVVDMLLIN